ncbi:hypothetical protein CWO17_23980 [Vibrio sp. 10N.286.45.A3]|uniref:DUF2971 domain-containing protein n=1 Tax=unclassified Vibrio TaxID=2614977 RepID=UPI000C851F8F|nr:MULTISPECIES: DUF2971 domain-containing protein [unclassified Vibrio]PMI24486.1 hypothetical protein BCU50_22350 [Vibrio sp. 10N.286.46.E10]PTO94844.1 hypothetical protein CWO17_23980 [Vibrio sp. 10N.286.45.A3]TKE75342.1 hypothetical protein FCV56_22005 [Vibrio sp. F12]TKE94326.1 hypothetical protein FCV53_02385 [Vibrio sp. F12]TKF02287.1 hypothetical protein FCV61_02790 [Vibrio sp. F12]
MDLISRYLTLDKFKWLLEDDGLFVAPSSMQSDENEGICDHTLLAKELIANGSIEDGTLAKNLTSLQKGMMHNTRETNFINSWYSDDKESMHMWDEYTKNKGVMIISDTFTLRQSIASPLKYSTKFNSVKYDTQKKLSSYINTLFLKDDKYYPEKEYRLLFDLVGFEIRFGPIRDNAVSVMVGNEPSHQSNAITIGIAKEDIENASSALKEKKFTFNGKPAIGYVLSTDLTCLIHKIILSPNLSERDEQIVRELCRLNHINAEIFRSVHDSEAV